MTDAPLIVTPIGVIRTPFSDRASAPRQAVLAEAAPGVIELVNDGRYEHALEDLETFRFIWVLFWFHLNESWSAKVRPPRSEKRRGLFATRSPYRPNPIGMSVVELVRIEGLVLYVRGVDMIDGTPVLDIKPYVPYTDSFPDAGHGWLEESSRPVDPGPSFSVEFAERASEALEFLANRFGIDLRERITLTLAAGPAPHPYRRIRADGDAFRLAVREWRVRFTVEENVVTVRSLFSGYRARELRGEEPELAPHRAFVERFGADGEGDAAGPPA